MEIYVLRPSPDAFMPVRRRCFVFCSLVNDLGRRPRAHVVKVEPFRLWCENLRKKNIWDEFGRFD